MSKISQSSKIVFLSYSHDSFEHKEQVLGLANRLRSGGLDCHLDQYEFSPPEGWPRWMTRHISESDFVLVICSEAYNRRVSGHETHGAGLGAIWEGQIITQEIYNSGGKNLKYIPIILDPADTGHIPLFLQSATRYCLSNEGGYDDLYRRLTNQPLVMKPGLGEVQRLAPHTSQDLEKTLGSPRCKELDSLVLLLLLDGQMGVFPSRRIQASETIELELCADDPEDSAFMENLGKNDSNPLAIAYGSTAHFASIQKITQVREEASELWRIELVPQEIGSGISEMAFANLSADDIANLRARRILLDERSKEGLDDPMNQSMLEVFVEGFHSPLKIQHSPIPGLYETYRNQPETFLVVAKLVAIALLRLSNTVEHVLQFDLTLDKGATQVIFRGRRPQAYSNVEPTLIVVEGECLLG